MANVSGGGTLWNLPNLDGILFSPSIVDTPFLNRLTKFRVVDNPEFAMTSNYTHETAAQPAITETASLTAPTAVSYVRDNEKNVCQIFQEKVSLSYAKLSAAGRNRYSEVATSGYAFSTNDGKNPVADELAFQQKVAIEKIRRDLEYSALNGSYQLATSAAVAYKMRGIITASTTNTVAAGGAAFSSTLFNALLKIMADNGAPFGLSKYVVFVNAFQKQKVTSVYAYVPTDRSMGGAAISEIMTDFGIMEVVYCSNIPAGTVLVCAVDKCAPVFQPVPGKSLVDQNIIWEQLSKTGAGEDWQLYAQLGIDYGSAYFHGTLTGLATA